MIYHNYIGHRKTTLPSMIRGVPAHDRGNMKDAYSDLKKKGFFIFETRSGDPYFSLYPSLVETVTFLLKLNRCPYCNVYLKDLDICKACNRKIPEQKKEELKD